MPKQRPYIKKDSLFRIGDILYYLKKQSQNGMITYYTQKYIVSACEMYSDGDFFYKFRSDDGIFEICMSESRFLTTPFKCLFASEQEAYDYARKETSQ